MTRAVYLRRETNLPLAILMGCSARSIRMAINTLAQDLVDGGNADAAVALRGAIPTPARSRTSTAG